MLGILEKVNPFKSSPQQSSLSKNMSSLTGENKEGTVIKSVQNPGLVMGLFQKINPFWSSQNPVSDSTPNTEPKLESNSENMEQSDQKKLKLTRSEEPSEPSSPKVLGFEWNHFKDSVEVPAMTETMVPAEGGPQQTEDDEEGLLEWWGTVEGWNQWNESTNFEGDDAEQAIEAAADRVFMAARLFVHLFNQREVSLNQRILEMLKLADAADCFHKKTVTASVGGGVASVAGSITTITGLALAPFTFGTSLIVTAVGIGVATAGGITSASANITDTMHSRTDRAKVEHIILGYQEEIRDIKECLQFLQTGMETLEEWNFEQYVDNISRRAMNKNVKHVMKEGGRAGKALLINTESLISTVQVLGAAGGAAKATQVITVASGVMSGLFLALDVFFLAKDSMELRKGAKTEFAAKIREVCKELQDGFLELKKITQQLEAIMDNFEEEEEEEEEVGEDLETPQD
ncbi:apolipoprotein L6 isoform X2 [Hoplias malabaricus]|uniref:apolipoprotein L6 isoform X2 n=1 Tax=Hoplias malabaricus TaxID=27720 RepID=UPI00346270EA